MAHKIIRKEDMFVVGGAWHSVFTPEATLLTVEQVRAKYLGFDVEAQDIFVLNSQGVYNPIPENQAIVRKDDGRILGVVGGRYEIVQNGEMLDLAEVIAQGRAVCETGGAIDGGRRVWLMLKGNEFTVPGDNSPMRQNLLFATAHDGSLQLLGKPTAVRVVCDNTLTAALKGKADITIRHTASAKDKLAEAKRVLEIAGAQFSQFKAVAQRLAQVKFPELRIEDLCVAVCGKSDSTRTTNAKSALLDTWRAQKEIDTSTGWGALNAVTDFVDHGKSYHGNGDEKIRENNRLAATLLGPAAELKRSVAVQVLEMCGLSLDDIVAETKAAASVEKLVEHTVNPRSALDLILANMQD